MSRSKCPHTAIYYHTNSIEGIKASCKICGRSLGMGIHDDTELGRMKPLTPFTSLTSRGPFHTCIHCPRWRTLNYFDTRCICVHPDTIDHRNRFVRVAWRLWFRMRQYGL